jgi:hypothetical protein
MSRTPPLLFSDGGFVLLGGQHITNAYMHIRREILGDDPDVHLEERWRGGFGEVLHFDTPLPIRRAASRLHNWRQLNSQNSTFYDLIRKMAQLASETQTERQAIRRGFDLRKGTFQVGPGAVHPVKPSEAILSPDRVYQAYLDSGYHDSIPSPQKAKSQSAKEKSGASQVCCPPGTTVPIFLRDLAYPCVPFIPVCR